MSETANEPEIPAITPEEMAAHRQKMGEFYAENIPLLEQQHHYESLLADIDEARLKRAMVRIKLAEVMSPPPPSPTPPAEGSGRKLKTE